MKSELWAAPKFKPTRVEGIELLEAVARKCLELFESYRRWVVYTGASGKGVY